MSYHSATLHQSHIPWADSQWAQQQRPTDSRQKFQACLDSLWRRIKNTARIQLWHLVAESNILLMTAFRNWWGINMLWQRLIRCLWSAASVSLWVCLWAHVSSMFTLRVCFEQTSKTHWWEVNSAARRGCVLIRDNMVHVWHAWSSLLLFWQIKEPVD